MIDTIRASPPSRRVQGKGGNVCGTYPSRKMGLTIQFESHKVELWAIYQMEHEEQVLEFYDQPPCFKIQYTNKSGRKIAHYHTPDFFVLRQTNAGWEEWKTEAQLQLLAEKYPTRYQKTLDGTWQCPPGEAYAAQFGLKYYVHSDAELNPIEIQNLMFLEDYLKSIALVSPPIQARVLKQIQENQGITLAELLSRSNGVRANDLYGMIAAERVYVDIKAQPLVEHKSVRLYSDKSTHDAYVLLEQSQLFEATINPTVVQPNSSLMWDGKLGKLVNEGQTTITLLPELGQPVQLPTNFWQQLVKTGKVSFLEEKSKIKEEARALIFNAHPKDLELANYRLSRVIAYLEGKTKSTEDALNSEASLPRATKNSEISVRTLQRWVKQFRHAETNYGCGYLGLLPQTKKRGNSSPKAPTTSSELLDKFIEGHFETPRQAKASSVYLAYSKACREQNLSVLSRSTFYKRISVRRSFEQISKRKGTKVAYNQSAWHWELTYSTPRHGDRPFAVVHIDHTQLDIELRSASSGRLLGRPWLTMLIDAYSRRILAVYLTFDPPSYRSCMMALRICVSRFGRFPNAVVVDGGKEFHSLYFDTLLAKYHCIKKQRPGAKPRFGSVIERLFNTTNTQFVFNLLGNTQASKQPRTITKDIDPKHLAVWTLGDLYTYLVEYAYSIYDTTVHSALGLLPLATYLAGIQNAGERLIRHIAYDEEFILATYPSPRSGLAQIQPGKGIKVNYLYYWSEAFRNQEIERTKVPVRYDPFDVGVAYAYVQGRWVKCISQYYGIFSGRSEKELLLASQEIKQNSKLTNSSINISASRLADFIGQVHLHEALLIQRLRDLEANGIRNVLSQTPSQKPVIETDTLLLALEQPSTSPESAQPERKKPLALSQIPIFGEYR